MDQKMVSSFPGIRHMQHHPTKVYPRHIRLLQVKILPQAANHKKKETRRRAFTLQIALQGNLMSTLI